jgi:hypothetical protein
VKLTRYKENYFFTHGKQTIKLKNEQKTEDLGKGKGTGQGRIRERRHRKGGYEQSMMHAYKKCDSETD